MREANNTWCNVCGMSSEEDEYAVFLSARKGGEDIDICTPCVPSVIHGSGLGVKSNAELRADLES